MFETSEVARVSLRPELLPVQIYSPDGLPLPVAVATLVHYVDLDNPLRDGFALCLLNDAGDEVEWLQFETLEIATDQAFEILGIEPREWK